MDLRHVRHGVTALALAGSAAAAPSALAAGEVTVIPPGGAPRTVSLDSLDGGQDVRGRGYELRSEEGARRVTVTGFSLEALLSAADVDPFGFRYAEVLRPGGGAVTLSRWQVRDADAFPDGPPVVYGDGAGTHFVRPSSGPGDVNAPDAVDAPSLTVRLSGEARLKVRAEASALKAKRGRVVRFLASAQGASAGERLTYSWYFDDGSSATGERVRHRFSRAGSYDVVVGVTTPGDRTGASAIVTVRVGKPKDGPNRKGGGDVASAAAPDSGAASDNGGGGASASPAAAKATAAGTRRARRRAERDSPAAGRLVEGALLSAAAPARALASGARTGRPRAERALSVPGPVWGGLAVLALLGVGVARERRTA